MSNSRPFSTDFVVVIRQSGERTFDLCRRLVALQVHDNQIFVVSGQPFETTLRSCYEIGISSGADWMVTIDADVLPRSGSINRLVAEARAMPRRHLQVEATIADKLTYSFRCAGVRCYRISLLHKALPLIPSSGNTVRPETHVVTEMRKLGHPSRRSCFIFGVHDEHQYFRDIYAKTYLHAIKHMHLLAELTLKWKRDRLVDPDFAAAVFGVRDGLAADEIPSLDRSMFSARAKSVLNEANLNEKDPISPDFDFDVDASIAATLQSGQFSWFNGFNNSTKVDRAIWLYRRFGWSGSSVYAIGVLLSTSGNRFRAIAERVRS